MRANADTISRTTYSRLAMKFTAGLTAGLMGCSITMSGVPDHWNGRTDPRCDASVEMPVTDFLGALIGVSIATLAGLKGDGSVAVGAGVASAILVMSGTHGVSVSNDCEAAREKWDRYLSRLPDRRAPRRQPSDDDELTDEQRNDVEEVLESRRIRRENERRELERLRREDADRKAREAAHVDAGVPVDAPAAADGGE